MMRIRSSNRVLINVDVHMERNNKIQILRAIAIIAVVMIHTCPAGNAAVIIRPFLNFCVATFLFLSGYLTKYQTFSLASGGGRILRVIIPYIIWSIVYGLLSQANLKEHSFNLLTAQGCYHLYYVFVYIQLTIITPILLAAIKNKWGFVVLLISPIAIVAYYILWFYGGYDNEHLSLVSNVSCLRWIIYYYIGLCLGNGAVLPKIRNVWLYLSVCFFLVIQMLETQLYIAYDIPNSVTQCKLSCVLTNVGIIIIFYRFICSEKVCSNAIERILEMVGNYSFGIYLIHPIFIKLLGDFDIYDSIPYVANSLLVLMISFCGCYLGSKILGNKISRLFGLQ